MAPLSRANCQKYGTSYSGPHRRSHAGRLISESTGVVRTVSQAWRIGHAVALCKQRNNLKGIPAAILQLQNGACLFVGKIVDVQRVRRPRDEQHCLTLPDRKYARASLGAK